MAIIDLKKQVSRQGNLVPSSPAQRPDAYSGDRPGHMHPGINTAKPRSQRRQGFPGRHTTYPAVTQLRIICIKEESSAACLGNTKYKDEEARRPVGAVPATCKEHASFYCRDLAPSLS